MIGISKDKRNSKQERSAEFQILKLKVNGLTEPLGLDEQSLQFSWQLLSTVRGARPRASRVLIATSETRLNQDDADVWDSGFMRGSAIQMNYGGSPLCSRSRYWWKVIVEGAGKSRYESPPTFLDTGLFPTDWRAAWIWKSKRLQINDFAYFRKEIIVREQVVYAKMFVSAHNTMQIFVGGVRIGGYGSPAPTHPQKRKYYLAYEVTSLLTAGKNCIAVIAHYLGGSGQNYVNALPGFRMQLEVAYADGTSQTFKTDTTWEALKEIPHRIGTPYQQNRRISAIEDYDARKSCPDWLHVGFDKAKCKKVATARIDAEAWPMKWQEIPEGAIEEIIVPTRIPVQNPDAAAVPSEAEIQRQVFDAGKIVSGWPRLTLAGIAGATIRLRYSEELDAHGYVKYHVCNETSEHYYDQYTMRGDEKEEWQPDISYKAFRYVEVTGYPGYLTGEHIRIVSAHTGLDHEGAFHCSDELLNAMAAACVQTQKNNVLGQIVDCPHREQAQYLADTDLQSETLLYNFDSRHVLGKTLSDFADAQREDGTFPFVFPSNPDHVDFDLQIPEWDLHYCTLLWHTYFICGDVRLLERHYETAKRMTDYFISIMDRQTGLVPLEKGWHISDWPYPTVEHSSDFLTVQNIKLYEAVRIIAEMASRMGQNLDKIMYQRAAGRLKKRLVKQLYDFDQKRMRDCLGSESFHQGVNAIALSCEIIPQAHRSEIVDYIASTPWVSRTVLSLPLLRVLLENGCKDDAYRLIRREEYPGWGYMMKQGATTMWEGWDDVESHCHAWNGYPLRLLQEYVAGIAAVSPGFADVRIQPYMPADLSHAEASIPTIRGPVRVRWERNAIRDRIRLLISIPPTMKAHVILTVRDAEMEMHMTESGLIVWEREQFIKGINGVKQCIKTSNGFEFRLTSGDYDFTVEG